MSEGVVAGTAEISHLKLQAGGRANSGKFSQAF